MLTALIHDFEGYPCMLGGNSWVLDDRKDYSHVV